MSFFRNPEVKRTLGITLILDIVFIFAAFLISTKCGILTAVFGLCLTLVFFITTYNRYKKITVLAQNIDFIIHGDEKIKISQNGEGELSILESEIQKMLIILKQNNEDLGKEKLFLSNSIADISHQIRTPLTSINLILSLLQNDDLPKKRQRELLGELKKLISSTDYLVTTLLKISKLDAGTIHFDKREVSLEKIIEKASSSLMIPIELKGQTLNVQTKGETVKADPMWLAEAIANIMKNCHEHTPEGGTITVKTRDEDLFAEITISDNGSGIREADLPHIFERFYKGEGGSKESFGIGLALSGSIIRQSGGVIKAKNMPEGGAEFTVRFYKKTI